MNASFFRCSHFSILLDQIHAKFKSYFIFVNFTHVYHQKICVLFSMIHAAFAPSGAGSRMDLGPGGTAMNETIRQLAEAYAAACAEEAQDLLRTLGKLPAPSYQ